MLSSKEIFSKWEEIVNKGKLRLSKITDGVIDAAYEALHQIASVETARKNVFSRSAHTSHGMSISPYDNSLRDDTNFQRFLDGRYTRVKYGKYLRLTKSDAIIDIDVTRSLNGWKSQKGIPIGVVAEVIEEIGNVLKILKSASSLREGYLMTSTASYDRDEDFIVRMESYWLSSEKVRWQMAALLQEQELMLDGDFSEPRKMWIQDIVRYAGVTSGSTLKKIKRKGRNVVTLTIPFQNEKNIEL